MKRIYHTASTTTENMYQYNGKEMLDFNGYNMNDYGARYYDAALGRWNVLDRLFEKYPTLSPYNYCLNNPLIIVDPDGNVVEVAENEETKKTLEMLKNDPKAASTLAVLEKSDIVYHINVAESFSSKEYHLAGEETTIGGNTAYSFRDHRVNIMVHYDSENDALNLAALADEVKTAEQFENNEIGFEKVGKYDSRVLGYDPGDEVETKLASVDALKANGLKVDQTDPNGMFQSTIVLKAIENGEMDFNKLIDILMSTKYKQFFDESKKYERAKPNPKDDDAHNENKEK